MRKSLLVFAAAGLAAAGAHAQTTVGLDVIQKYAPSIYLNAYDKNHPGTVEDFFAQSTLYDQNGNVLASPATPAALAANAASSNHLSPANGVFPSDTNDFESGLPIVDAGNGTGQSNAPVYVKVIDHGDAIDLKYYMFYPWNGFQGFQAGVIVNFKTQPYFFDWGQFASHYGDWEHVTVRISEDAGSLIGVYYSQHGNAQYVTNPTLENGTHPVVYPGWNSHANYPSSGNNINTQILDSPGIIPLSWLKVVDVTTNSGNFVVYGKPNPFFANGVQWKPWQNPGQQLVLLDDNPTAAQWLSYNGTWGPQITNNVGHPPALPSGADSELYFLGTAGSLIGVLKQYTQQDGIIGPQTAGWNQSNEP